MGFKEWLTGLRLERTERNLRLLRSRLKDQRKRMDDLQTAHSRAEVPAPEYQTRKAQMEAHRHELLSRIHELEQREKELRAELESPAHAMGA